MDSSEQIKQRFELLKIARELLNEEYINRRAEDHNKWVAENEESWRTRRRNIPYPPFAQYPTDEEVVRAASNLYNFIYGIEPTLPVTAVDIKEDIGDNIADLENTVVSDIHNMDVPSTKFASLLPDWIKKNRKE